MTAQGNPRTIFRRAIEHGNLTVAEATIREIGHVWLTDALDLVALVVQKEPDRRSGYTVRWLRRLLQEDEQVTIEEIVLAAAAQPPRSPPSAAR